MNERVGESEIKYSSISSILEGRDRGEARWLKLGQEINSPIKKQKKYIYACIYLYIV